MRTSYAGMWILSYAVPLAAGWAMFALTHSMALCVPVMALAFLGICRAAGRRGG